MMISVPPPQPQVIMMISVPCNGPATVQLGSGAALSHELVDPARFQTFFKAPLQVGAWEAVSDREKAADRLSAFYVDSLPPNTILELVKPLFGYAVGTEVNLEVDIIARYLERLLQSGVVPTNDGVTLDTLRNAGYRSD